MPFRLDQVPAEARARYTELGRQFGCTDALAQAEQTLAAYRRFGDAIGAHGFIESDAARLQEASERLTLEVGTETDAIVSMKRTSQEYVGAIRAGKAARQRARSILYIVAQRLAYSGDPIAVEASRAVAATLQQTESSRGDPIRLASQLDQLRATLTIPRVDKQAELRGGLPASEELMMAAERLRKTAACDDPDVAPPSTVETANADLLCGVIVELVRDARRAARSAARAQAQPLVASAFELTKLYGPLGGSGAESERSPSLR